MSLTTSPLKFNKKEKIAPLKIWLLPEIFRTRKEKLDKGQRKPHIH
jgi:hypothetical protein